jgi:hypothetical protein
MIYKCSVILLSHLHVVTKIYKITWRWIGHVERMEESRLTKEIYEVDLDSTVGSRYCWNDGEDLGERYLIKLSKF